MKGLTFAPTGAIAAAATTSLPETPSGQRNYDYRFSWIRDATFALWGLYSLGFDWEAIDFLSFIADVAASEDDLQIMYGIGSERDLAESTLDDLPGYANSRPVRVGNAAYAQKQHDVWGALLDSVYLHSKAADHLDNWVWAILSRQVDAALKHWREPDAGIWEVRGPLQHFTSSKLMRWVALDRAAKLAAYLGQDGMATEWEMHADEIKADILANGVDDRGVLTQHSGDRARRIAVARAVTALPAPGRPSHPRNRARRRRRAHHRRPGPALPSGRDGRRFQGRRRHITICSFWLVSALCEIDEHKRARELCAKLLSLAGPLELYAEEIDPHTGQQLGNFPQAFTHLALINAVLHLIATEQTSETWNESSHPTFDD